MTVSLLSCCKRELKMTGPEPPHQPFQIVPTPPLPIYPPGKCDSYCAATFRSKFFPVNKAIAAMRGIPFTMTLTKSPTPAPMEFLSHVIALRVSRRKLPKPNRREYSAGSCSLGSHRDDRNDFKPRYRAKRLRAGVLSGVSISSGN